MFIDQIEVAIGAAYGARALDDVSRILWRGLAEGLLDDTDAQRIADAIHVRRTLARATGETQEGRKRLRRGNGPREPQRPPVRRQAIERRRASSRIRPAASRPCLPLHHGRGRNVAHSCRRSAQQGQVRPHARRDRRPRRRVPIDGPRCDAIRRATRPGPRHRAPATRPQEPAERGRDRLAGMAHLDQPAAEAEPR